jgi:DNA-binding transcriptional MerR regulator
VGRRSDASSSVAAARKADGGVASSELPDKLFFKIGEVAQVVGVRAHVLRYWESEFAALRPLKTRGAHRVYRRRDVELAMLVKRLLHDEGLTIAGAKKRLRESGHDRVSTPPDPSAAREVASRADLLVVRDRLTDYLRRLEAVMQDDGAGARSTADVKATVTGSVPNSVPVSSASNPSTTPPRSSVPVPSSMTNVASPASNKRRPITT